MHFSSNHLTFSIDLEFPFVHFFSFKPKRMLKYWWQRRTRGFDDSEMWSLDYSLAEHIVPRLKRFKEVSCSYPQDYESLEAWQGDIQIMIDAFERIADNEDMKLEEYDEVNRGLDLFRDRYFNLWW